MRLPDTVLPDGLDAFEIQEAYRALKGHALRVEVYADDGSPAAANPYTVTEQNFTVSCLQNQGREPARGVLRPPAGDACRSTMSGGADDPRVGHEITLESDDYGNITARRLHRLSAPRRLRRRRSRRFGGDAGDAGLRPGAPARAGGPSSDYTNADRRPGAPGRTPTGRRCLRRADTPRSPASPPVKGTGITNLFTFDEIDGAGGVWPTAWSGAP